MSAALSWTHEIAELGERTRSFSRVATGAERQAVAKELGLLGCDRLEARYEIKPLQHGRYRLMGTLAATVTQACIATLEPVAADINEEIAAEFSPSDAAVGDAEGGERSVLGGVDVEQLENGRIDAGRIVFESLSGALDPYPRTADAEFDWKDPKEEGGEAKSPFAALARLKRPE